MNAIFLLAVALNAFAGQDPAPVDALDAIPLISQERAALQQLEENQLHLDASIKSLEAAIKEVEEVTKVRNQYEADLTGFRKEKELLNTELLTAETRLNVLQSEKQTIQVRSLPEATENLKKSNETRAKTLIQAEEAMAESKTLLEQMDKQKKELKEAIELRDKLNLAEDIETQYIATVISPSNPNKSFTGMGTSSEEAEIEALDKCLVKYSDCQLQKVEETPGEIAKRDASLEEVKRKIRQIQEVAIPRLKKRLELSEPELAANEWNAKLETEKAQRILANITQLKTHRKNIEKELILCKGIVTDKKAHLERLLITTQQMAKDCERLQEQWEALSAPFPELQKNISDQKILVNKLEDQAGHIRKMSQHRGSAQGKQQGQALGAEYAEKHVKDIVHLEGFEKGKSAALEDGVLRSKELGYRTGYKKPDLSSAQYKDGFEQGANQEHAANAHLTAQAFNQALTEAKKRAPSSILEIEYKPVAEKTTSIELIQPIEVPETITFNSKAIRYPQYLENKETPVLPAYSGVHEPKADQAEKALKKLDRTANQANAEMDALFLSNRDQNFVNYFNESFSLRAKTVAQQAFRQGYEEGWESARLQKPVKPDAAMVSAGHFDRGVEDGHKAALATASKLAMEKGKADFEKAQASGLILSVQALKWENAFTGIPVERAMLTGDQQVLHAVVSNPSPKAMPKGTLLLTLSCADRKTCPFEETLRIPLPEIAADNVVTIKKLASFRLSPEKKAKSIQLIARVFSTNGGGFLHEENPEFSIASASALFDLVRQKAERIDDKKYRVLIPVSEKEDLPKQLPKIISEGKVLPEASVSWNERTLQIELPLTKKSGGNVVLPKRFFWGELPSYSFESLPETFWVSSRGVREPLELVLNPDTNIEKIILRARNKENIPIELPFEMTVKTEHQGKYMIRFKPNTYPKGFNAINTACSIENASKKKGDHFSCELTGYFTGRAHEQSGEILAELFVDQEVYQEMAIPFQFE